MLQTSEGRFPLTVAPSIVLLLVAKMLRNLSQRNRFLLDVLPFFAFNTRGADGHAVVAAGTATATVHEPVLRVEDGERSTKEHPCTKFCG